MKLSTSTVKKNVWSLNAFPHHLCLTGWRADGGTSPLMVLKHQGGSSARPCGWNTALLAEAEQDPFLGSGCGPDGTPLPTGHTGTARGVLSASQARFPFEQGCPGKLRSALGGKPAAASLWFSTTAQTRPTIHYNQGFARCFLDPSLGLPTCSLLCEAGYHRF